MRYIWPTPQDMWRSLPPGKLIQDGDGTVLITGAGRGWLRVPGEAWGTFAAAVKRGDYDAPAR